MSSTSRTQPDPPGGAVPAAPRWARLVATFGGIGYLRPAPGSWGSAATVIAWYGVAHLVPAALQPAAALLLAALAAGLGIPAATQVARAAGNKDPQFVVIDEVAGQLLALAGAPLTWKSLLAGFILFRGFDIVKPPPVRRLERIAGGGGIVLDDVAAGLYALIVMQALVHFQWLS